MKIYGIGTDIVKVDRIKRLISKKRFKEKIFSKYEILRCEKKINKHNCYAKRFAAKEAFSKALGTGIAGGVNFNEINVLNEKNGKPFIKVSKETKKKMENKLKKKIYKILLSLSDEDNYAVAFVTITI